MVSELQITHLDFLQSQKPWGSVVLKGQAEPMRLPEGIIMLALKINKVLPDSASGVIERREIWREIK